MMRTLAVVLVVFLGGASTLFGQQAQAEQAQGALTNQVSLLESDAFMDPTAARIYEAALAEWERVDETVIRYTALVKQRLAARIRTPLKDRTIYNVESAHRVFWDRDSEALNQVLALREQTPAGIAEDDEGVDLDWFDDAFDPAGDRLLFGMSEKDEDDWGEPEEQDFWVEHPFGASALTAYRFRSGDTLTLSFPDGRRILSVELQVIPRYIDVHKITGSLWIEPETGALMRAVYRLSDVFDVIRDIPDLEEEAEDGLRWVPGIFKPFTFELGMIAVEYALWDFEVWLPRSMRMEGMAAAGVIKIPATLDASYRIESVFTEADLAAEEAGQAPLGVTEEVHFETRAEAMEYMALLASRQGVDYQYDQDSNRRGGRGSRFLMPEDRTALLESPHLPPPIWEDAAGFTSSAEVERMFERLADLPLPEETRIAWAANWGFERPDLVRYNRIEGPAVGARLQLRVGSPIGPVSLSAVPFIGISDLDPKVRLSATHETLRRKVALGIYRELTPVSRRDDHLGFGNSMAALLWGRDDGEYFRATGADLVWTPPTAERETFQVRLYAERHESVRKHTDFALTHAFGDWDYRGNIVASEHDEVGGEFVLSPWWGTDPLAPQAGLELYGQVASGDEQGIYSRASVLLRGSVPFRLSGHSFRAGLEVEGGRGWGEIPIQREWYLGNVSTLRGYEPSTLHGASFARTRAELAWGLPAAALAVFSDAGWAGTRPREFHFDDSLFSVGIGMSVLDGLIRFDLSRGLRSPRDTRFDFYLDAPF